ncbi:MAG: hypothetical protein Q9219_007111 [cf. Caloplaca sp. 3 TL-2023]
MSFGLSLSDLRLVFELCFFIYEKAFSKAQGANIQYFDFGRDIKALAETLQRLEKIITQADGQRPPRPWQRPDTEYRAALQPVGEAAGNFKATIQDCQSLLANNTRFGRNTAGFVNNVQWSLVVEREVNNLRDRVRFHLIKLGILLKPFELLFLLEIRGELRNLRWDIAEIRELLVAQINIPNGHGSFDRLPLRSNTIVLPSIPPEVARRFSDALAVCPPASFTDPSNLPLQPAADALSTVEYNPGLDFNQRVPKVPQYLNLLKSRWLLAKLESSSQLTSQGPHAFWVGYLAEIRNEIINEYRRFETPQTLEAPSEDVILLLSGDCFSIWVPEPSTLEPAPLAEQGPTEEKILTLDLPDPSSTRQCSLTVLKRSSIEFRLVTTIVDKYNKDFRHEKEIVVNSDASAIVPAYAIPSGQTGNPNSLLISNYHVHDLNWHFLKSFEDVKSLQQALLGYRVFHEMSDVRWSLTGSSKAGKIGQAHLQLWQLLALRDVELETKRLSLQPVPSAHTAPPLQSPAWEARTPLGQRRLTTLSGSTVLSDHSMTSRVTGPRGEGGTALLPPNPPVFVLFTLHEGRYTFLHMELTCDIIVDKNQCDCRNGKRPCSVTVLANRKKGLKIRRYTTREQADQGLTTWDLALFRYPQHPRFKELEVIPKVNYLRLDFATPELNKEFQTEMGLLAQVRSLDLQEYNNALDQRR